MEFFRVISLKASRDKRLLKHPISTGFRKRGAYGIGVPAFEEGFVRLKATTGLPLGIYREDELEQLTKRQFVLELGLTALLNIFPNKLPSRVLGSESVVEDFIAVELVVPKLRRVLKSKE